MPRYHACPAVYLTLEPGLDIAEDGFDIEASSEARAAEALVEIFFDDLDRPATVEVLVLPFGGRTIGKYGVSTRLVPESRGTFLGNLKRKKRKD